MQGEREVNLYLSDQIPDSSESGQQTPVSRDLETGDHVTTNMTLMVEKDPLGLVEAVSQQLEMVTHQDEHQANELQESCLNQDTVAINMDQDDTEPLDQNNTQLLDQDSTQLLDQDSTQPLDQDSTQPLDQDIIKPLDQDKTEPLDQDTVINNTAVVVMDTSSL